MDRTNTLLIVAALLLLTGGGYAVYTMTRGLRNNNPFNIEDDGLTPWEGLDSPRNDGIYLRFISAPYGLRAGGRILSHYVTADGIAPTVAAMIARFAPPAANDTAAYIADVANQLGIDQNAPLQIPGADLLPLSKAIIRHENGINPYTDDMIANALALA